MFGKRHTSILHKGLLFHVRLIGVALKRLLSRSQSSVQAYPPNFLTVVILHSPTVISALVHRVPTPFMGRHKTSEPNFFNSLRCLSYYFLVNCKTCVAVNALRLAIRQNVCYNETDLMPIQGRRITVWMTKKFSFSE